MDNKILKKLDEYDVEKLGEGAKGKIYKLIEKKNNIYLAIKMMIVQNRDVKNIMDLRSPRWREVKLLLDFTKDVKSNKIRNLPLIYGYQTCKIRNYNSIVIYYEYFDDILKNWLQIKRSDEEWMSFILQSLITIKFLREKYKLTHNDLTWVNIMYNKIEKGGYWKYITNEYELYIPNMGYEFIFWDFGSSKSYKFPLRHNEKQYLDETYNGKRDQKYILDILKRIKMEHILNRYSLDELKDIFKKDDYLKYLNKTTEETTEDFKRFKDNSRLDYVISKSLSFYLVEKNEYKDLMKKKGNIYNREDEQALPSKKVMKKIVDNIYNRYDDLIKKEKKNNIKDELVLPSQEIQDLMERIVENDFESDIDIIINKYFSKYKKHKANVIDTYNMK
jgi:hypothetical protein